MADIAGLEPVSCGFKSRSPYPYKSSDSSTDRMLGYEPGDVGSIPPLTTIFSIGRDASATRPPRTHGRDTVAPLPKAPRGSAALGPTANRQPLTATTFVYPFQALSSAGQNSGLIIRKSRVRIPQGQPL